ncbi:MAG: epoxyqueuosine reductase QueH [Chitinispirillia bacterium]|nr:epoxyqueuosine reductase QueH [Chitinispirillia bacterium]
MKPKLLLHICCAPDEAYAVEVLRELYELHCFFCNPNIFPDKEYELRLNEAQKAAEIYGVPFIYDDYLPDLWVQSVNGLTDTPEGGERCRACFYLRLSRTAAKCAAMGRTDFATVMSVSPHKNVKMLDEAGNLAANEYEVSYIPFNFKKSDGFRKSIELSHKLGLYRQNYCGCELSYIETKARVNS